LETSLNRAINGDPSEDTQVCKENGKNDFIRGLKAGIPIALGYLPVSFTFGLIAVNSGIPALTAIIISLTNLTSAGQFAGIGMIAVNAPLFEIAITTFVINIRYSLMSLSLSQRISSKMPTLKRAIMAFGITDEIFAVSSLEKKRVTFPYMMGLIGLPYFGWASGTILGALTTSFLPESVQSAMGVALYGMFIALVVPSAKHSRAVLAVALIAVAISSALWWIPSLNRVSVGWAIIIATVISSLAGAILFPIDDEGEDD
jgi:predicted branched-subunit amino acid permease